MFAKLCLVPLVALLSMAPTALAIDDKTHEGTVVSAAAGKLVMTDKEGKNEHSHDVPLSAKVTLDGKDARLTDMRKGDAVKVTVDGSGKVSTVAATRSPNR
jgi:hypothetical protein